MWSLVSNASVVVQLVMLILVAASVTSWIMIFQRSSLLRAGRRALDSFEERFWSGIDLSKLYRQAGSNPDPDSGVEQIFRAGFKEFSRLRQQPGVDPDAVMEGVARAMRVAISREEEKLDQSVHRSVRYRLGDHELLPRSGHCTASDPRYCGSRHRRSTDRNRHWPVRGNPCSNRLQPFRRSRRSLDQPLLHIRRRVPGHPAP